MGDTHRWNGVLLAGGNGTRMNSKLTKVLHPICGLPMAAHILRAMKDAGVERTTVVVGAGDRQVQAALGQDHSYATQREQLGSGHALLQAKPKKETSQLALVVNGDLPLVRTTTLQRLMTIHVEGRCAMSLLTCEGGEAIGLGRIQRDRAGRVVAIIEWADANEEQRRQREINVGAYCFQTDWLWSVLPKLQPSHRGEIYLTDLLALAQSAGLPIGSIRVDDPTEAIGVDTRARLADAECALRQRIREHWMLEGVTMMDPLSTFIDAEAVIGQDAVLYPQTMISGKSVIGEDCTIGPRAVISGSTIGRSCRVSSSVIEDSTLEAHVDVGPFSHLRDGAYLEEDVHIGNYVEIKKSRFGRGSKSGHFSYIGNAALGKNVNVGAGTITCNFDGINKNQTVVGDDVFLGCDTMLVAPVTVGAGSKTGAGAVVTKDVPPSITVVGVPARPLSKG